MTIIRSGMVEKGPRGGAPVDPALLAAGVPLRVVFSLKLSVACPACRDMLPVQDLREVEFACPSCAGAVRVSAGTWRKVFDEVALIEAFCRRPGKVAERHAPSGDTHGFLSRATIRCDHCHAELPGGTLDELTRGTPVPCPECGEEIPARPADEAARRLCPGAVAVVGEGRYDPPDPDRLEAMFCPGCGASLQVGGGSRVVTCQYCQASATIPDQVWIKLHPQQQPRDLFVIAKLDDRQRWSWLLRLEKSAEHVLDRGGKLPPAALEGLSRSQSLRARRRAAADPAITPELLDLLSRDEYESSLRAEVAKNPAVDRDTLVRLLDDHSGTVQRAALANPGYPLSSLEDAILAGDYLMRHHVATHPDLDQLSDRCLDALLDGAEQGFLDRLAANPALPVARLWALRRDKGPDPSHLLLAGHLPALPEGAAAQLARSEAPPVRHAIASHPEAPSEVLRSLAKDADSAVAEAARENPAYRPTFWNKLGF